MPFDLLLAASYETSESNAHWLQAIFELAKGSSQNRSTKILQPTLQLPTNPRNGECFSDTGDVAKGSKPATAGSDDPVHAHVTEVSSVDPPALLGRG